MSRKYYDPDPSRRGTRSRVPPQLRAWVFGRRRKRRTHDPAEAGVIRGKPYGVGKRGGVYWSRGRKPRYDPQEGRLTRYYRKAKGYLGQVENNLHWLGVVLGVFIPAEVCRAKHGRSLSRYYIHDTIYETKSLFGWRKDWSPWQQIWWKFTNPNSVWTFAFWGSLITHIATRFGALKPLNVRLNTAVHKLTLGTLIASVIGGLFMGGGDETSAAGGGSDTTTSQPSGAQALQYYG